MRLFPIDLGCLIFIQMLARHLYVDNVSHLAYRTVNSA
jgi:hypothetical protein